MSNVIAMGEESEQTKLARKLLKECQAGEIDGFVLVKEFASGIVDSEIVGAFSADQKSQDHLAMTFTRIGDWFADIDTEVHEYD